MSTHMSVLNTKYPPPSSNTRRGSSPLPAYGTINRGSLDSQKPLNSSQLDREADVVPDRYRMALFMVGVLGFVALLPYNLFCTASGYYDYQLRDRLTDKPSQLGTAYESSLTVAASAVGLMFAMLNTYLTARISYQKRIYFSLIVLVLVCGFSAAVTFVSTDDWQAGYFAMTMACLTIATAAGSVVSAAALGVASMLPPVYVTSVLIGMGFAGVFTSLASIIAIAVSSNVVYEGLVYFLMATVASVGALLLFVWFNRLAFVRHYVHKRYLVTTDNLIASALAADAKPTAQHSARPAKTTSRVSDLSHLLRLVWPYCLSMTSTFFVTLAIFPAVMARVVGTLGVGSKYFVPIYTFLVFNVLDVVGRYVFGLLRYPRIQNKWTPTVINVVAFARLAFIPLILLCNVQPRSSDSSVMFGDGWFIAFSALLALSNGYIKNLSSMYPPQLAPTHLMETCGSLLVTAMYVGLLAGGASSFLLLHIVSRI